MKRYIIVLIMMFVGKLVIAQKETSTKRKNDTLKTEVVNVVTSYAPKVTDAYKIKRKPVIQFTKDAEKKQLDYNIISVPVASTFVPKSGTLKGIDVGKKEQIFDNYISAGFGNNTTPYLEAYMHKITRFDSEYGGNLKFILSSDPVKDTELSSSFYNIDLGLFYKQEERYFNWKAGLNLERNKYNWYGLPTNIDYTIPTLNVIDEEHTYKYYNVFGELEFQDSYIEDAKGSMSYFSDNLDSGEFQIDVNSLFSFPLGRVGYDLEDLHLGTSIKFIGGSFAYKYNERLEQKYNFFNLGLNPYYKFYVSNFDIKIGGKTYFAMDYENKENKFFIYPDVHVNYPIIPKFANLYVGASGDLHTNSYRTLSEGNPYMSPTANIAQTNEAYNFFGGLKGILGDNINYNVIANYKNEEAKPLYSLHKTKSENGINTADGDGFPFFGYEYGNSFDVLYDDVKTLSIFGEIEYDASKNIVVGFSGQLNNYSLTNEAEAWNLPKLKAELFGKYKADKWYAATNIYFVGNRKGKLHDGTTFDTVDLKSFVDVNFNGGYHFNPLFSAFIKVNNATNSNYQQFTNFNAQGIQVIGGFIWKFDNLF